MRIATFLLQVGIVFGCVAFAGARPFTTVTVALHEGANDPETEGWTRFRPFVNVATFPVTNDAGLGVDAWAVDDNGAGAPFVPPGSEEDGSYGVDLTSQQLQLAGMNGWRLRANLRVVDQSTPSNTTDSATRVDFQSSDRFYNMKFGREADGSPLLALRGVPTVLDFDDLDSGYHLYELVSGPDQSADLFVDGTLRFSGYTGIPAGAPDASVVFGSTWNTGTGHANYNLVQLDLFQFVEDAALTPEPSPFWMWGLVLAIAALVAGYRLWSRSRSSESQVQRAGTRVAPFARKRGLQEAG